MPYMSRLLSVSLPDDLAEETEAFARSAGKTKSEVVCDALRRQLQVARLPTLQRYGRERAETARDRARGHRGPG